MEKEVRGEYKRENEEHEAGKWKVREVMGGCQGK